MMNFLFVILMINLSIGLTNTQDIRLPEPSKKGGMPLMEALSLRQSVREMSGQEIPINTLSDLLWAAQGVNRDDGKRTAPSAMNMQEIDVYVYTSRAVYLYIPGEHMLKHLVEGDFISQNVYLFCAQEKLNTVVLGMIDREVIKERISYPIPR
jgi:hypothetical protein